MKQKGFALILVIIIITLLGIVGAYYLGTKKTNSITSPTQSPPLATTNSQIQTTPIVEPILAEEECIRSGGEWKKVGIQPAPECTFKSKDAGKQCRDNSECDGECLAPEGSQQGEKVSGICSDYNFHLGCFRMVDNGTVSKTICVD